MRKFIVGNLVVAGLLVAGIAAAATVFGITDSFDIGDTNHEVTSSVEEGRCSDVERLTCEVGYDQVERTRDNFKVDGENYCYQNILCQEVVEPEPEPEPVVVAFCHKAGEDNQKNVDAEEGTARFNIHSGHVEDGKDTEGVCAPLPDPVFNTYCHNVGRNTERNVTAEEGSNKDERHAEHVDEERDLAGDCPVEE